MLRIPHLLAATATLFLTTVDSSAQPAPAGAQFSYADLADRALPAPVALVVTVSEAIRLPTEQAPRLAPGFARLYVEATATRLIRGPADIPPQVRYLADVPLDAKGKVPKLKKTQMLILARPVSGRSGELQLVSSDAQIPLTPEVERRVRAILTEAVRPDAPPVITGVASAFHVAGTIPGEGETQVFLTTVGNRPISLNILRRPGQQPVWSVALTEVVDEAAQPPERETLLWYRLACGLPAVLPGAALADLDSDAAAAARADYRYVREQLGACTRSRPIRRS